MLVFIMFYLLYSLYIPRYKALLKPLLISVSCSKQQLWSQYLGSIRFNTTKSTYSTDSPQKTIRFVVLG